MKITEFEMRGLLTGKCIPGDMKVNEQLPAYLVRKFSDLHEQLTATTNSLTNAQEALKSAGIEADTVQAGVMELVSRMNQVVAENVAIKSSIPNHKHVDLDNDNMDDVSLAEAVGFNDAVTLMNRWKGDTPATDAYLNAVRAEGVEMLSDKFSAIGTLATSHIANEMRSFAAQLRASNAGKDGSHE
ncbi:hypothetical protein [Pantoea sp. WEP]|uniref:hypothetical protein n=1 Tax=Pantoea sp. WEP TaxID=3230025 RepID=UPI0035665D0D